MLIVWDHQLYVAGEEGGSATMVAVFVPFLGVLACCHISSSSSYVEKWYEKTLTLENHRKLLKMLRFQCFCSTLVCTTPKWTGFNSLTAVVADLRPLFFDLRRKLISPPIFVPSAGQG
jgi:hypothetical protein